MALAIPKRLKRPATIGIATVAIMSMGVAAATWANAGPQKPKAGSTAVYLVQFDGEPLATYAGGVNGIAGTKPAAGSKIDTKKWNYTKYREYLQSRRKDVLRKANIAGKVTAEYDNVLNGVAVQLTPAQVVKLRATAGVRNVWKNAVLKLQTADTPKFLGLDGPGGVWQRQFGGVANAGEGVIVGVLDTGITPESASFAALPEPRPDADTIAAKWQGVCDDSGEEPVSCNNKLIGARYYNTDPSNVIADRDFVSARDFNGHGTHTSSTAAGDNGVAATVNGESVGNISGMAPAARVAMYKVCWEFEDPDDPEAGGCPLSDSIAAIDDAIADGVDVINYSIGGTPGAITDPIEMAFLQAAAAGVFVSASAGNTPGESTADHNSPWLTTVAASTHDRTFEKTLTLGNGTKFTGPGVGGAVPSSPLIDSINAVNAGSTPEEARICVIGSLDPAKVTGKIVICQRGVNARTDKGLAVKQAGGVGMVMYNPSANSLNADFQAVPSIHVDTATGNAVKAYAATAGATASMTAGVRKKARAPQIASFSSSGPAEATAGDLLKPDITAPGVDVIAAVAPPGNHGNSFDAYSGTSMSSPHIAGIAALMKGKFPNWSPAAIKSALMTTAYQTDNTGKPIQREGGIAATPLDYGAGHVRPTAAYDPGLVYDSGPLEWLQFICGVGEDFLLGEGESGCATVGSIDPSNLNYPSISVGDLAGKQTVTRTVTNVTNQASIYVPKLEAPPGFTVKVSPPVLLVLPRKTATYKLEITKDKKTAYDEFKFGAITWLDLRGHSVRSPIAVRATPIAAPAEVTGTGTTGSKALSVTPGFSGNLTAKTVGLAASKVTTKHLVGTDQAFNTDAPAESAAVMKATVTVPANALAARVATFASQYPAGTDLDLFVYAEVDSDHPGKELVALSAGSTADESVDLPAGIAVDVYAVQFAVVGGEQDVHVHAFVVPPTSAGNLTATPASQSVTLAKPVTVTASWKNLTAGQFYMGAVLYGEGSTISGATLVSIKA